MHTTQQLVRDNQYQCRTRQRSCVLHRRHVYNGAAISADGYYILSYILSLTHKFQIIQESSALLLVEDLVVGLLVDAVGDLLVVLVTEASLVGGVVNLGVDLLVGKALSGLVAAEGVLGLVHESRHVCDFEGLCGG
jgi:hypothetical protein